MTIGETWTWTDGAGESVDLTVEWRDLSGRSGQLVSVDTSDVIGGGARVRSTRQTARTIAFRVVVAGEGSTDATRSAATRDEIRRLERVFSDRGAGTLRVTQPGGSFREIEGVCTSFEVREDPRESDVGFQIARVVLQCPDPDWLGNLRSVTLEPGQSITVANAGDMPAYPVAVVTGPCTSFGLLASPDRFTFDGAVTEASPVTVDMRPAARTVTDAGGNRYGDVDQTGDMWALPVGERSVSFTASGSSSATRCVLTWRDRFAGV